MFECSRCTVRVIRALIQDAPPHVRASFRPTLTPQIRSTRQRRSAVSLSRARIEEDDQELPFDTATSGLGISPVPKRHLELELRTLTDKFKLADYVQAMLTNKEEFDKALALVRLASSSDHIGNCTVSWNHLIRYALARREPEKAWQLFNDMKKRAQFPDSHTYIALFKGLAAQAKTEDGKPRPKNVMRVINIYNSMYLPNSRCRPAVIHANAALQICSLANDMDSIWSIVSRLGQEGANSADGITYTVLLNAIRTSTIKQIEKGVDSAEAVTAKSKAVHDGVEVWTEVVTRWRSGQVALDEKLITAMAQVLLLSPRLQDWNYVFELFYQTMDIPRATTLDKPDRGYAHVPQVELDEEASATTTTAFNRIEAQLPKHARHTDTFSYAKPGSATLSMLIETCIQARIPQAATEYWTQLTSAPFQVRPDLVNLERLLKLYSINRSSALAAGVGELLSRHDLRPRKETLHLAMTACLRDRNNSGNLEHAGKIVDTMMKYLGGEPDITLLVQYFQLALESADAAKIEQALLKLQKPAQRLSQVATYGSADAELRARWTETLQNITALFQGMLGALDTVCRHELVPVERREEWKAWRSVLTQSIGTVKDRLSALGMEATVGTRRLVMRESSVAEKSSNRSETRTNWAVNKQFNALSRFKKQLADKQDPRRPTVLARRVRPLTGVRLQTRTKRSAAATQESNF